MNIKKETLPNGDIRVTYYEFPAVLLYKKATRLKFFRHRFNYDFAVTPDGKAGFKKIFVKDGRVLCETYDGQHYSYLLSKRAWETISESNAA